jgi:hypothetical protein
MARRIAFAVFLCSAIGASYGDQPDYPTKYRVQISESCPIVAKWLTQGLVSGAHWQLAKYDKDLGILTFNVVALGNLSRSDVRAYVSDAGRKSKGVQMDRMTITLRSLVGSELLFSDVPSAKSESCTISAAARYIDRKGNTYNSSGTMERQFLEAIKVRYEGHGLDY